MKLAHMLHHLKLGADDTQTNIERQQSERQQDAILDEETKEDSLCLNEEPCSVVDDSSGSVDHAALDSDAEDDEGTAWNDHELSDDYDLDDGLDEDGPPQPDLLFDDSLLDLAGGVEQLASGNMSNDLCRGMAKTGWHPLEKQTPYEYLIEPYEPRPASAMPDDYPHLYDGPYGPTEGALRAVGTTLGAYLVFCPTYALGRYCQSKQCLFRGEDSRKIGRPIQQASGTGVETLNVLAQGAWVNSTGTREDCGCDLCVFMGLLAARTIPPKQRKARTSLENGGRRSHGAVSGCSWCGIG
ncbi:hypothetical protein PPTG_12528 [Phytophthora nicotianae INRA-310]|uniref:PiggyBac transposable element-derived protein domain-containing protein n=1 Tax=Phytophthora nicotianae (strain INRA-310) TaxID=761204 RepID=W2Q4E0_PHYN3|nr:hypothetical protein PPTG_12528 [Phytophthora nicotianae INRA-310]ETN08012.1 hypothetical protein PPTG_12528 [Phytophthora nicotianae INRA-310]